jgi:signal transduction histidine kinase
VTTPSFITAKAAELRSVFDKARALPFSLNGEEQAESLLAIRVSQDAYAVRVNEISGLVTDRKVVPIPSPISELLGVAGVRGALVPVYSLAALLGYGAETGQVRWLALCGTEEPLALAFGGFEGYTQVPLGQLYSADQEDENRNIREQLLQKELEVVAANSARDLAEARAAFVEELERKIVELEAFSYSVSHDLRAPLRSIDGFSQLLLEDYRGKLDSKGEDYLHRVSDSAQRMGELIDDLLLLSRVGRAEIKRNPSDLSSIARTVFEELRRKDPDRRVDLRVAEKLVAEADNGLMRVALDNLLGNAWKFTAKVRDPRIEIGTEERQEGAVFFVRDNGAGFDMSYAEGLFHPFQRLHTESDFPGTGIGLATVHRIIDRHGGRIWAEGAVGQGATFFFTISPAKLGGRP